MLIERVSRYIVNETSALWTACELPHVRCPRVFGTSFRVMQFRLDWLRLTRDLFAIAKFLLNLRHLLSVEWVKVDTVDHG